MFCEVTAIKIESARLFCPSASHSQKSEVILCGGRTNRRLYSRPEDTKPPRPPAVTISMHTIHFMSAVTWTQSRIDLKHPNYISRLCFLTSFLKRFWEISCELQIHETKIYIFLNQNQMRQIR